MYYRLDLLRFYLAISVVFYHIYMDIAPQSGVLAVMGFFYISGFLITKLLNTTYFNRPKEFLINRALRIYPAYWTSVLIGLVLISLIPNELISTNEIIRLPINIDSIIDNLIVFGLQGNISRIVPPAWSLDIELHWYIILLIASFFGSTIKKIFAIIIIPLPIVFTLVYNTQFYGHLWGSGFSFCLGALYFYKKPQIHKNIEIICAILLIPIMYIAPHIFKTHGAGMQSSANWLLILFYIVVLHLSFGFFITSGKNSVISTFLGKISYPVFLTHWYGSAIILFYFGYKKNTLENLIFTIIITVAISTIIVYIVEKPISAYRDKIRSSNYKET